MSDMIAKLQPIFESDNRNSIKDLQTENKFASSLDQSNRRILKGILRERISRLEKNEQDPEERGYDVEVILYKLLWLEELNPFPPYYTTHTAESPRQETQTGSPLGTKQQPAQKANRRGRRPGGEQIDGFFQLDGRFFLLEAKWQKDFKLDDVHKFQIVVQTKLVGTVGVFLSMSGFQDKYIDLIWGLALNVLLVDGDDLKWALAEGNSWQKLIRIKLCEAARLGRIWYSMKTHMDVENS